VDEQEDWWSSKLVTPIGIGILLMMGLIIIGLAIGILVLLVKLDKKLRVIFLFCVFCKSAKLKLQNCHLRETKMYDN
jgi:hypothetical protein